MGTLVLIPANVLTAIYHLSSKKLTLLAEGRVTASTSRITFERIPWLGGLRFELQGWSEGASGPDKPYTHEQSFDIQLPSPNNPSNTVIIVTANHPEGAIVHIKYVNTVVSPAKDHVPSTPSTPFTPSTPSPETITSELKSLSLSLAPYNPTPNADVTSKHSTPSESEPKLTRLAANDVQLNELFREPFIIKQAAGVPKGGAIQIKFDPAYLTLIGSGVQDADINWTLNSLQAGTTQIFVTVHGGGANYVHEMVYNVRIFLLDAAAPRSGAPRAFLAAPAPAAHDEEILDFFGRVNIAVRIVRDKYPDAKLYEVEATPNFPGSVTHPNGLAHLKVVFNAQRSGKQGTAIIESVGWGVYGPVQFVPFIWVGDVVIPWPPTGLIKITEADNILKTSGFTQPYFSVVFRQPLYPGNTEPYYIFKLENGPYVLVGAKDGKIVVSNNDSYVDDWTNIDRPLRAVYR